MSLSIFSSLSFMAPTRAGTGQNSSLLSGALDRLVSAKQADKPDTSGLQMAARLQAQGNETTIAQNTASLLQTTEDAFNQATDLLYKMKDLALQATQDSADNNAINTQLNALNDELQDVIANTSWENKKLFGASGVFASALHLHTDSASGKDVTIDLSYELGAAGTVFDGSGFGDWTSESGINITSASGAWSMIDSLGEAIGNIKIVHSVLNIGMSRLGYMKHAAAATNVLSMKENGGLAAAAARDRMLNQTGESMLQSSGGMNEMVLALLER